jgi:hypothetical protein
MRSTRTAAVVAAGVLAMGAAGTGPASALPNQGSPNTCISMNGGDWNACDVGNAGRGDLPYVPVRLVPHSAALCIHLNQGDAIACRVGSVDGRYPG